MQLDKINLKSILVDPGYISEDVFKAALNEAKGETRKMLRYIVDQGLLKDEEIGLLIAQAHQLNFIDLNKEKISDEAFQSLPELVARTKRVAVFAITDTFVSVAMEDPDDFEFKKYLEKYFNREVKIYFTTRSSLEKYFLRFRSTLSEKLSQLLSSSNKVVSENLYIDLVNTLIEYAYFDRASDIHIEPRPASIVIRYRIDGIMHEVAEIDKKFLEPIVLRIKILAGMRTDDHASAQDGKLSYAVNDKKIDIRISIVPITEGENIVLRLLSTDNRKLSFGDLGLSAKDMENIKKAIQNPHGMILVTGPTGSGKTTTIYEILKLLNTDEVHISTIEDPVEYKIEGISQIQVNKKTNLTFANGLRAIVRQDPDIIMVGEIRDKETAGIAVNSALTGHLVLSTLHANSAASTLTRLIDMEIEPFLAVSTINVIIAQRLVRKICEKCRVSYQITEEEKNILSKDLQLVEFLEAKNKNINALTLYRSEGCKVCSNTGYMGRVGLYEILEMSEAIKDLIVANASSDDIAEEARKEHMKTIFEDGIDKALNGLTTFSEVFRVTKI